MVLSREMESMKRHPGFLPWEARQTHGLALLEVVQKERSDVAGDLIFFTILRPKRDRGSWGSPLEMWYSLSIAALYGSCGPPVSLGVAPYTAVH